MWSHDGITSRKEFETYYPLMDDVCIVACDDLLEPEHLMEKMQGSMIELHFLHSKIGNINEPGFGVSIGGSMHVIIRVKGGPGSGHHGHRGRPGLRGGSLPGKGSGGVTFVERGKNAAEVRAAVERLVESLPPHLRDSLDGAKIFVGDGVRVLGSASDDTAIIRVANPAVLNHEIGHLINTMYGKKMGVTAISRKKAWRDAIGSERMLDYRMSDFAKMEEDFAGAFQEFTSRPDFLARKYPKHYEAMKALFEGRLL